MENFIFSLNVTIPIFIVILLGYVLRKIKFLTEEFVSVANKYVFKVALPVMLFRDIATSDIIQTASASFVLYCMIVTILMFLMVWLLAYLVLKDKTMVGAFAQGASRGSAAILGVAFVESICGSVGMAPLMIVAAVPFFNVLSVIILTFSASLGKEETGYKRDRKAEIKKSLKNIAKNPIIIGIFAGIPFTLLGIKIPQIPLKAIGYVSNTATPLALIAIGAGFDTRKALDRLRPAIGASFIKLVGLPLLFLPFAALLKFGASEMVAILIMLSSPSTVTCYIMAKNMDNDDALASNIIVITTLFSSVTLTLWIFILRSFGLI